MDSERPAPERAAKPVDEDSPHTTAVLTVLRSYSAILHLGESIRGAVDAEQPEQLQGLLEARGRHVATATRAFGVLEADLWRMPEAVHARLISDLDKIQSQDRELRSLIGARLEEIPAQLAEIRQAQARLGSYQPGAPGQPESVDRRG